MFDFIKQQYQKMAEKRKKDELQNIQKKTKKSID